MLNDQHTPIDSPETLLEHLRRELTKDDINALPLRRYQGEILMVRDKDDLSRALERLSGDDVLGFDTETRPSFRKGVMHPPPALMQLAGRNLVCLVQINQAGLSNPLMEVMSDPAVVKTGVALRDDVRELWRIREFEPSGFVDLSETAKRLQLKTNGLRNMAANMLGLRISKRAQCSNWARRDLSLQQITYAATDAWISRKLYLFLQAHGFVADEDALDMSPSNGG